MLGEDSEEYPKVETGDINRMSSLFDGGLIFMKQEQQKKE